MNSVEDNALVRLANFAYDTKFEDLPGEVVAESKRVLLDSVGCALAGTTSDKGRWALAFARESFGGLPQARVIGFGDKISAMGATFVNSELINALDYDAILPPGHVSPFVIPAFLAVAESEGLSGKEVITACALAHEISYRIGAAMAYYRDVVGGKVVWPAIAGYSCCIFGGVAAVGKVKWFSRERLANALGLAGQIAPIQAMTAWVKNPQSTTAKYLLAGWISQAELTAASLVEAGYNGDTTILDAEYGFWRFAGSPKWQPASVVDGLGKKWRFPPLTSYKPFPACRIFAGALDCLASIVKKEALKSEEIEGIEAYMESNSAEPLFQTREMKEQVAAEFNPAYCLSLVAHGIKPGPQWLSIQNLTSKDILGFMSRIKCQPHPEFARALTEDPRSRLARVEVIARGRKFVEERKYPKGSPSPDANTFMTNDELVAKFKDSASYILPSSKIDQAALALLDLEKIQDIRDVIKLVSV